MTMICKKCFGIIYELEQAVHICSFPTRVSPDLQEKLNNLNERVMKLEKFMHENSLNIDYINSILERLTKLEEEKRD